MVTKASEKFFIELSCTRNNHNKAPDFQKEHSSMLEFLEVDISTTSFLFWIFCC